MHRENPHEESVGLTSATSGGATSPPECPATTGMAATGSASGRYGRFGGQYVAETLIEPLAELERAFTAFTADAVVAAEVERLLRTYVGRPTPLYFAAGLSAHAGGARIYLKREDLAHTGAHKINNALGQGLLARQMGKERLVADTGAGQHGVATATVARLLGLSCTIYMGRVDIARQRSNVERMQLLGAQVVPVDEGTATLKDAVAAALQDWTASFGDSHLLLGSVVGPHPFPAIVKHFQSVIGTEGGIL